MPKKVRQKKFLPDSHLKYKTTQGDFPARAELVQRHKIEQFLQRANRKKELLAESQRVQLLFRKEPDFYSSMNKGKLVRLYIEVDDGMSREEYIANWPIVREYVRLLKQSQGVWHDGGDARFFEMLEVARVASRGKLGYGKLAKIINKRIDEKLRAEKQNEAIKSKVPYEPHGTPEQWYEELIRQGYDLSVEQGIEAEELLKYFDVPEDEINLIKADPKYFDHGNEPVTTARVRKKLQNHRRHISK